MPRALLAAAIVLGVSAGAEADADYSGTYRAAPAVVQADVQDWGPDCGRRPESYTLDETPQVKVTTRAGHLFLKFPERTLRTNACWSPNPTLRLTSASSSDVQWRTQCRTPRGDSKAEVGSYTVSANGPFSLELSEVSAYDWRLNKSRCRATVRITRRLERLETERRTPTGGGLAQPSQPKEATDRCQGSAGPVARLALRPSQAQVEPGGKICFRPRATDARGCPVATPNLRWELRKPKAARGTMRGPCFHAAELTAEAEGTFRIIASADGRRATASVAVAAVDLSDITARRAEQAPRAGGPEPADLRAQPALSAGVQSRAVRRGPSLVMVLGTVSALLALGAAALFLLRRRALKQATDRARSLVPTSIFAAQAPHEPHTQAASAGDAPAPSPPPPAEPMVCPRCRRQQPPSATRCSHDGARLLPYSEYTAQSRQASRAERECPRCQASCGADAQFCGACGAKI